MAQLERPQKQVETSKTPPTIHTMEQLLRAGEASKSKQSPTYSSSSSTNSSSPSSPFFQRLRSNHDSEDDHGQTQKKSVLTKVKEKAKKLRHSLSKKKHEDGNSTSPSAAATASEGDGVEDDAEYHGGAPNNKHLYESEKSPNKANSKQHPRANPTTPEKHVISPSSHKHDQEKSLNRSLSKRTTPQPASTTTTTITPKATTTTTVATNTLSGPKKTQIETVAPKLAPVHVEGPSAAHSKDSKIQGLSVSNSKPTQHHDQASSSSSSSVALAPKTTRSTSLSYSAPRTPPATVPTLRTTSAPVAPATPAPSPATPQSGKNTSPSAQIWDKGVSVKEYLMNKLEPGEDDKALSQVISEAMSPRRTPGDAGVMEKVREAVTSLLRTEEPKKYSDTTTTATLTATPTPTSTPTRMSSQMPASINTSRASASTNASRASPKMPASTNASRSSSQIPVSFNAQPEYAVTEEENHGRILQAN